MKKKYVLDFDGDHRSSVVARQGNKIEVSVDEGELVPVGYHPVMQGKAISIRHDGRLHLVHITGLDNKGHVSATINGRPISLSVMDELRAQALESRGDGAGNGAILADIPGLVIEVKVKVGQQVHPGDPVVVVEAMKMQNELCATVAGLVKSIPVEEGQAVNPGDPLILIEPDLGG